MIPTAMSAVCTKARTNLTFGRNGGFFVSDRAGQNDQHAIKTVQSGCRYWQLVLSQRMSATSLKENQHEHSRFYVTTQQRLCCSAICCGHTYAIASAGATKC